jgi:hypothetical protein
MEVEVVLVLVPHLVLVRRTTLSRVLDRGDKGGGRRPTCWRFYKEPIAFRVGRSETIYKNSLSNMSGFHSSVG